jgi:RNA polymerase sigma-70 factor (ECF subfamily)
MIGKTLLRTVLKDVIRAIYICEMNSDINKVWLELNEDIGRYVCDKVNHQDHCHDILQDVYLKMIKNIDKIKEVDNIKAYLIRISSNTIADHYRTKKATATMEEDYVAPASSCCGNSYQELAGNFLLAAINQLPDKYKEALTLTEIEGLSQKEYAEKLGISFSGAKSRVQRAREKLKDIVKQCCDYQFDRYGNVVKCCGEEISQSN